MRTPTSAAAATPAMQDADPESSGLRAWLRPGTAVMTVGATWVARDREDHYFELTGGSPQGITRPAQLDPAVHTELFGALADIGVVVDGTHSPAVIMQNCTSDRGQAPRRSADETVATTAWAVGGPAEFVRAAGRELHRRGEVMSVPASLQDAARHSRVLWCADGTLPHGWRDLDGQALSGALDWCRVLLHGRYADLEPVAGGPADVSHAMVRARRLAAARRPDLMLGEWDAGAIRGPATLSPEAAEAIAAAAVAKMLDGGAAARRWLDRVDLDTRCRTRHPILPVPEATMREPRP